MHSFRPSRARVLFEVLCALTVSASCVAAWMDLGTLAFLPAAGAAGLYGLVHLFDLRRPKSALAAAMPEVAVARDVPADRVEHVEALWPVPAEPIPEPVEVEAVVEKAPKPKRRSRKKQPATEEAASIATVEVLGIEDIGEAAQAAAVEEEYHAPIAPLFEPKALVSQQRTVFGRKAG